jgi:CBS domain-containing protein
MRISELESKHVVGISPGDTLNGAAKYLADDEIGALVVFRGSRPIGLFSERDLVRAVADDADLGETEVKEYMTQSPITVKEDASVGEAVAKMNDFGVRHVLVMNGREAAGMVSMRDIVALFGSRWPEL